MATMERVQAVIAKAEAQLGGPMMEGDEVAFLCKDGVLILSNDGNETHFKVIFDEPVVLDLSLSEELGVNVNHG